MKIQKVHPRYNVDQWLQTQTLMNDFIKHVATLDTASILVTITFLDKLFVQPKERYLVSLSLILFAVSIIAVVFFQLYVVAYSKLIVAKIPRHQLPRLERLVMGSISSILMPSIATIAFVIGLIVLVIFAIVNLGV